MSTKVCSKKYEMFIKNQKKNYRKTDRDYKDFSSFMFIKFFVIVTVFYIYFCFFNKSTSSQENW